VDQAQQQVWMQQWRRAAVALAEVRRRTLAAMDAVEALRAAERVLDAGTPGDARPRVRGSGLVEQQRLFHRKRR
jgi:hypothetical protein